MKSIVCALVLLSSALISQAQSTTPTTRPAGAAGDMKFMSADKVFEQMLKPTTRPARQLDALPEQSVQDKSSGATAIKPNAPVVAVRREGTFIIDRLGRLSHTDKGDAQFSFESDGKALHDPPMILLPNLLLYQIEEQIKASNRDLKLRVSGMVTEYKGRNYLLLEKVIVPFDASMQF